MHPFVAALLGGGLIGLAAVVLMFSHGRILGVSGVVGGLLPPNIQKPLVWRLAVMLGVMGAPLVYGLWAKAPVYEAMASWPMIILAGFLVGLGTSLGSGCTSGHGVCGLARLSGRSVVATGLFMVAAMFTVAVVGVGR